MWRGDEDTPAAGALSAAASAAGEQLRTDDRLREGEAGRRSGAMAMFSMFASPSQEEAECRAEEDGSAQVAATAAATGMVCAAARCSL